MKRHTLSVLFKNKYNALPRITGLFSGKGFNIDSMSFGVGEEPDLTRMTITTVGDKNVIEQIAKQLHKLVDVTKVIDLTYEAFVERELALIKVHTSQSSRSEMMQIVNIFRAKIIDISPRSMTVEITGKREKVDAALSMLREFGIVELARTGSTALKREYKSKL